MTSRSLRCGAVLALWIVTLASAGAATVYRCGNAYSDVPCPQARVVDADDARTETDVATARNVASREAALASSMAADRLRAELQLSALRPAGPKAAVRRAPVVAQTRRVPRRWRREDDEGNFVAIIPAIRKAPAKR